MFPYVLVLARGRDRVRHRAALQVAHMKIAEFVEADERIPSA